MENVFDKIISLLSDTENTEILRDEPMSRHTTFKIGGPAEVFVKANGASAAESCLKKLYSAGIRPMVIGNGSNLLVSDSGIKGVVLKLCGGSLSLAGDREIIADAGATAYSAAKFALKSSLSGFEFLYGIPGSMGGAVVMNAGAYGGEISGSLVDSRYFTSDGRVCTLGLSEHEFGYRTSFFKKNPDAVVLSSRFRLTADDPAEISARMEDFMSRRRDKQPLEFPSAGSVFKRPPGQFAGALIEQCGLKGFTVGGAQVSPKHAGFIVNLGSASCDDVLRVVDHIRSTVLRETGFELECEICHV